jgi:general secretion pathway protein L
MPRTIIGLDITEDIVAAVQVKSLMQGYQIIGCTAVPVTEEGGISAAMREVCEAIDCRGSACNSVIEDGQTAFRNLSMPFTDLKKIRQTIGFELETVMASTVDTHLIDFIDVARTSSQTDIIAASVKREYIGAHIAIFAELGIEPEILGIRNISLANQIIMQQNNPANGILLYLGSKSCSIVLFLDRKIVLIRHLPFAGKELAVAASQAVKGEKADQLDSQEFASGLISLCGTINLTLRGFQVESGTELLPEKVFLTGPGGLVPAITLIMANELGMPVSLLDLRVTAENIQLNQDLGNIYNPLLMDNGLALAIRESKKGKGFNFRREEFQLTTQFVKLKKELIQASIYGSIILVLFCINLGVGYHDLKKRTANLDRQITGIFTQTFPEITTIVDPLHQMKTKISELKEISGATPGTGMQRTVLEILNDISGRIPGELNLQVDRMVIDQDGVQIRGATDTFNTVDNIKKGLESSEMFRDVVIASANLDKSGKGVRFEIKMEEVP